MTAVTTEMRVEAIDGAIRSFLGNGQTFQVDAWVKALRDGVITADPLTAAYEASHARVSELEAALLFCSNVAHNKLAVKERVRVTLGDRKALAGEP